MKRVIATLILVLMVITVRGGSRVQTTAEDVKSSYFSRNCDDILIVPHNEFAHHDLNNDEIIIQSTSESIYVYNADEGKIMKLKNNELQETWEIPKKSLYCGFSDDVGHIFMSKSEVYAFTEGSFMATAIGMQVMKIANDVESVIVASYWYDEEKCGQPMFLMRDGSIKVYANNALELNPDEADREEYLLDLK